MQNKTLLLFVIFEILAVGIISGQQLTFADNDELEFEIKVKNGMTEIKVEVDDDEYKFELETSDIDEILQITSIRTEIPIDELKDAMKLEIKDKQVDVDIDEVEDETEDNDEQKDLKTDELERKLQASIISESSEVKINLEFLTKTTDMNELVDEIIDKFEVTQQGAKDLLKIKEVNDGNLEEKFTVEIEVEDGMTEVKVKLRYVLDSTNKDEIINSIVKNSKLDSEIILDLINEDEIDDLSDESNEYDDSDQRDNNTDDSDSEISSEIAELRKENLLLREEIDGLKQKLEILNMIIREQIQVIMDTLASLRS